MTPAHGLPENMPLRAHLRTSIQLGGHGVQNNGLSLVDDLEQFHAEDHAADPHQEVLTHS